uniref:Type IV secretion system protein n=1 Tax=Francisella tularensis subsp. novicida PA10-7858 TaxID=1386968 RepID=V5T8S9_FRANO|nr:hypothetical protein [Francisella tularensis]AHB60775.1 hypothetical protein N894_0007 [Francisella tularensis subsp. novicida PA10-7858]
MKKFKFFILASFFCLNVNNSYATGMPVFDAMANFTASLSMSELVSHTATMSEQLAQGVQMVQAAEKNLKRFTDWTSVTNFKDMVNKVSEASRVGNSLGEASGGIAKSLESMGGDSTGALHVLKDTLKSAGAVIDEHSSALMKEANGFDSINKALEQGGADGMVSALQGNALLMQGIAKQNKEMNDNLAAANKLKIADIQERIQKEDEKIAKARNYKLAALKGYKDPKDDPDFDISKAPKVKLF